MESQKGIQSIMKARSSFKNVGIEESGDFVRDQSMNVSPAARSQSSKHQSLDGTRNNIK